MIFTLVYNEFIKTIDIDITKTFGLIQENLLNKCSLMIYNIEYTEIIIKNIDDKQSYILGSDEVDFNITFKEFLDKIEKTENDIDKIIIYDRKRDSNGNVCKNNVIIDRYTSWFQNYENNNFDASYLNESYLDYTQNNSHIIRFPLESLLTNILNINTQNQNNEDIESTQDNNPEVSPGISNLTIDPDLVNSSNEYFNNFSTRLNAMMNRYNNSELNNNNQNLQTPLSSINRQFMTSAITIFDNLILNINDIPTNEININSLNRDESTMREPYSSSLNTSSLNTSEVNTSSLNTSEVNTSSLNTSSLNTSSLNTSEVNTSSLNTSSLNTSSLNTSSLNTSSLNTSSLNTSSLNTSEVNTSEVNTSDVNTSSLNTSEVNTSDVNTSSLNSSSLNTSESHSSEATNRNESNNNTYEIPSTFNIFPISSFLIDTTIMYNNVYNNNFNSDIIQEDVKIILTEEEFNKIDSEEYEKENNPLECLICTEYFVDTDIFKKLKCNHVFHTECIKPWLCEESNKCPICRLEAGKGSIKN